MSQHAATVEWSRGSAAFTDNRYSRAHWWRFDGGVDVKASASPHIVPLPLSATDAVDPEEAFVASLSSCHMLWFLSIAAKRGFVVDQYQDQALGLMGKDATGKLAMIEVTLRPRAQFSGPLQPSPADVAAMHSRAHDECFIARSVKTEVHCEPVLWDGVGLLADR